MIREETVTNDMISERRGSRVGRQARGVYQECEADDCPCLYVWKVTETKRAVTKFSSEAFPQTSRLKLAGT